MGWAAKGHKWNFIPEQFTSQPRCCGPLCRMQNGRGWKGPLGVIVCRDAGSGQWDGLGLDSVILEVFSNLADSVILCPCRSTTPSSSFFTRVQNHCLQGAYWQAGHLL